MLIQTQPWLQLLLVSTPYGVLANHHFPDFSMFSFVICAVECAPKKVALIDSVKLPSYTSIDQQNAVSRVSGRLSKFPDVSERVMTRPATRAAGFN